ncbi:MAG: DUF4038 domain-containing protein [Verrucomicrobiota bacterium]|nr:DUF4038 domain-containing protein [Limisphaera sp.]MDW8381867.1 DUF4038 domain-containing protein [Verrucomicrobiota bacterium]
MNQANEGVVGPGRGRRVYKKHSKERVRCVHCVVLVLFAGCAFGSGLATAADRAELWGVYEIRLPGPQAGNPFTEVQLWGDFVQGYERLEIPGFYDGEGRYLIRFMPPRPGVWRWRTRSNVESLHERTGEVEVGPPAPGNHGPVRVAYRYHFAYADGTPFRPVGTTVYAWLHQSEALQLQTLETLSRSPFNKIRFCVFPKRYAWNTNEPDLYPFEGRPGAFDFARFNPRFFQRLEERLWQLQRLGIEADVILFHPYDEGHWGFDRMTPMEDDRYIRYVVARLSAFRNVWWSLANEFDFMTMKRDEDWERMGQLVSRLDPYGHLTSIHNGKRLFPQTRSWISHASIQNGSAVETASAAVLYRDAFEKPVVYDEIKYEGNLPRRWGNLTAEELVFRFWNATVAGTYATHGETYLSPDEVIWWSKGGILRGESPPRLAFLRQVLETAPAGGIEPVDKWQNPEYGGQPPEYYLVYLGKSAPRTWAFRLPRPPQGIGAPPREGWSYAVEILDTWNMTVTPVPGTFTVTAHGAYFFGDREGRTVELPGRPYLALRIRRIWNE